MTPPLALKARLMRRGAAAGQHWRLAANPGNPGTANEALRFPLSQRDTEDDAAQLLLSMSNIVTKEIKNNSHAFDDEGDFCSAPHDSPRSPLASRHENLLLTPRDSSPSPTNSDRELFQWSRARTVSIDSPLHTSLLTPKTVRGPNLSLGRPALISPNSTPIGRTRPLRRSSLKLALKAKQEHLNLPKMPAMTPVSVDVKEYKRKAIENCQARGTKIQTIGRKKFSWKNYPEVSIIRYYLQQSEGNV